MAKQKTDDLTPEESMMSKRTGQHADETAMEYLRRVVGHCDHENESLLDSLPSVEAVLDFFDLWHAYGTDYWTGVLECIAEGDDPKAAHDFIRKHKLSQSWRNDVHEAQDIAKEVAR